MKRFALSALFFIALLAVWHLVVLAKVWSVVLLPDPISVWEYLKGAAGDGTLLQASIVTMRRLLARGRPPVRTADRPVQALRRHTRRACAGVTDTAERL